MEAFWATLSSLMFAGTFILIKVGRLQASHLSVLWITLTVNVVFLGLLSLISYAPFSVDIWEWRYFILAGLFAPLLGRLFQFVGMSMLGTNVTTAITVTHPLVSVVLGIVILGETASYGQINGAVAIVLGSLLIGFSTQSIVIKVPSMRQILAFYGPVLASLAYGVSITFRKVGIESETNPIIASAVTVCTSWIVLSLYVFIRSAKIRCSFKELQYFVGAGVLSSAGPIFLYMALSAGSLVLVAPLAATTPLFVMAGTWIYSRQNEIFNRRILTGTCLICIGVVLTTGKF